MQWSEYIRLELDEIRKHKWIESEKAGQDLGSRAVMDWIDKYAARFRAYVTQDLGESIERDSPPR